VSGSTLFSRTRYDKAGGFRPGYTIGEDWDLWIRMVRTGATVVRTDHATFLYRQSPTSLTQGGRVYVGAEKVLHAAIEEAGNEDQRQWARRGLAKQAAVQRRAVASMALVDAYDAARAGNTARARAEAWRTRHGPRRVALRGMAVLVWPHGAVTVRDRRYAQQAK
jgi:hypothetical protein